MPSAASERRSRPGDVAMDTPPPQPQRQQQGQQQQQQEEDDEEEEQEHCDACDDDDADMEEEADDEWAPLVQYMDEHDLSPADVLTKLQLAGRKKRWRDQSKRAPPGTAGKQGEDGGEEEEVVEDEEVAEEKAQERAVEGQVEVGREVKILSFLPRVKI